MKIDGFDPTKNIPGAKTGKTADSASGAFMNMLDGMMAGGENSGAAKAAGAAGPLFNSPFIVPMMAAELSKATSGATVNTLDNALTDLSMFKNALSNNDIPLARLAPIVSKLSTHRDEIAGMINKIPDEELRSTATDTLSLLISQINQYHLGYA